MSLTDKFACDPLSETEATTRYDIQVAAVVASLRERVSLMAAAFLSKRLLDSDVLGPLEAALGSRDGPEPSRALSALVVPAGRRHSHRHLCQAVRDVEAAHAYATRMRGTDTEQTTRMLSALRSGWRHLVHATAENGNALIDLRQCCGSHHNRVRKEDGTDGRLFHLEPGICDEPEAPGQRGLLRSA